MGTYINSSSEIGGRELIGAWALKGRNTVFLYKNSSACINMYLAVIRMYETNKR